MKAKDVRDVSMKRREAQVATLLYRARQAAKGRAEEGHLNAKVEAFGLSSSVILDVVKGLEEDGFETQVEWAENPVEGGLLNIYW